MIDSGFLMLLLWQAIQITLLVTATRILLRATGNTRPLLAHVLWAVVLIKCLTPPLWSSSIGVFSQMADHLSVQRSDSLRRADEMAVTRQSSEIPASVQPSNSPSGLFARISVDPLAPSSLPSAQQARVNDVGHDGESAPWYAWWLFALWVGGATVVGGRLVARVLAFVSRLRSMPVRPSAEVERLARHLAKQLGLRRRVRIDVVEGDIGPALLGWVRPRVLVPAILVDKADQQSLRSLIAHELIHLRRGDLWWAGLQEIATCLWWFHPWVRQAAKSMEVESEKSCDEETVAALNCSPAEYARCLLDVLEYKHQLRSAPTFPGVRAIDITTERMERIMNTDIRQTRRARILIWPLMVIGCAIVLPGARMVSAQNRDTELPEPTRTLSTETAQPPVLPNPVSEQERTTQPNLADADWTVRSYNVKRVLDRLQQSGLNPEAAEKRLLEMLPAVDADQLRRDLHVHTEQGSEEVGGNQQKRSLQNGKLIMLAPNQVHEQVANLIQHGERFGFEQVLIEAALVLVPSDRWGDLDIQWRPAWQQSNDQKSNEQESIRATPAAPALPRIPTFDPAAFRGTGASFRVTPVDDADGVARNPAPVQRVSARTTTRQIGAMDITILDDNPTPQIVDSITGAKVLSMPKVITVHGRAATIEIGKKEQIVVGYKTNDGGESFEPMREEVTVGTRMSLSPEVVENRFVRLGVDLRLTRVDDLPQSETPPEEDTRTIQSLRENYIETICNVPLGDTLAIGGMQVEEDGGNYRLLCLLSCQLVESTSEEDTEATPTRSETKAVPDEARTKKPVLSLVAGSGGVDFDAGTHGSAVHIFDLLGKEGQKVEVTGDVHAEQELSRSTLTIEDLQIDYEDGDRILAEHAWIRLMPGASAAASLKGDVHILLGDRKLRANEAKIIGETVILTGDVQVSSDAMEFRTSELRLSVDTLEVQEAKAVKSLRFRSK